VDLRLRRATAADEESVMAAQRELGHDGFVFALGHEPGMPWGQYLELLDRWSRGEGLPADHVPSTFLLAEAGGVVVGRASIRHRLNRALMGEGGHIGFSVRPAHRRRGHATEILRQSLLFVRELGVERVLVTCDEVNAASAAVIERCGGTFADVRENPRGTPVRRYWIG
jgi:predicted acetyltransferase